MGEMPTRYDAPKYGGNTFNPDTDASILKTNRERIQWLMLDGTFRTTAEIRAALMLSPETEVTARLREMRKPPYGGWCIECRIRPGTVRTREYGLKPRRSGIVKERED